MCVCVCVCEWSLLLKKTLIENFIFVHCNCQIEKKQPKSIPHVVTGFQFF